MFRIAIAVTLAALAPLAARAADPEFNGTLTADAVAVAPRSAGEVTKVTVDVGQKVKKGDVLVELDPRWLQLDLDAARANLEKAKASHEAARVNIQRIQALAKAAAIGQEEIRRAEAELAVSAADLKVAEVKVEQAKLALEGTVLRSPVDGVVTARAAKVGATLRAGAAAVEVTDPGTLRAEFRTDPANLRLLGKDRKITVHTFTDAAVTYPAEVARVSPTVHPDGTVTVVLKFDPGKDADKLRPGSKIMVKVADK